ncbi:hypothetical protein BU24DRAFT_426528 [Aaosphaeria arxii CBS 175.79]|uniref:C2H2-type domain-containing protein n=1 Tax=Aaosphaeria arxii CBS 175.79 TaxID=1450172 RepID=A0A6A5XE44_9PLEO|nr:uncharacterized protein BU24DRAFT_426528 [Aaosphaeria arxii CBS 175.79]KAF2011445.1 hypothetical protein BU24DRAFT_426528 [Aaosphaeria arxii CBS 175.79]
MRSWVCTRCYSVSGSWEELLLHCRLHRCFVVCQGCNFKAGQLWIPNSWEYFWHLQRCHVCAVCEIHFDTPEALDKHILEEHLNECLGCKKIFATCSSLIAHLESGQCTTQSFRAGREAAQHSNRVIINRCAASCRRWQQFIKEEFHGLMITGCHIDSGTGIRPYKCPKCGWDYRHLSGLLKHVEDQVCGQRLDRNPIRALMTYIAHRSLVRVAKQLY